jgi:nucleoside-diphosphate-sugar epimerase
MFNNKVILVTGASGFIGKNISKEIKFLGGDVIELSSQNDLRNRNALDTFNGKVNYVIHAAGKVFVPDSWNNPISFLQVNAGGTETVMEFCRLNKIGCTYISGYVYGRNTPLPILESAEINPSNPYAYSKFIGEKICKMYHDCFQVPVQIIRPFNVYGPGQSDNFLIPLLIKQFKESNIIKVKDLNPRRDFVYLDDLITLILKSCFRSDYNVFNCGTGRSTSVAELIEYLRIISEKNISIENENLVRTNEIDDSISNIDNARVVLNWKPEIDIKSGLSKLMTKS